MGIKMCWPRSTPTLQPCAAECVSSRAVPAGKDKCEGVCYLRGSAQQYGRVQFGTVRWKGLQQNSALPLHCVHFCYSLRYPFVATQGRGNWEKDPRLAQTRSMIKKQKFNSLKLTPLLPSLSPLPRKRTHLVQMYSNRRGIQKGVWFKKERKKVSIIFLSCRVFFSFPFFLTEITEIWFFYESYLQNAEYLIFPHVHYYIQ